jgi:hypothetical protein
VPGWTGTYWMKHVTSVVTQPDTNFWMKSAYRIPLGKFPVVAPSPARRLPPTPRLYETLFRKIGSPRLFAYMGR